MFDSDRSSRAGVATIDGGDRLLARLQELESSHRKQQELLLREQMRQKEMLAEHRERVVGFRLSSPDMQTPLEDRTNPSGSSDPSGSGDDEKRQKRRVDTKTRSGNKFDENATVCGAAVPFQYLVDQKLKEDTTGAKSTASVTSKSQPRKYLKRGEGLKRFGEQFAKPRWNQRCSGEQKGSGEDNNGARTVAVRRQVEVDRPKVEVVPARKPRESTESEIKEKSDLRAFEILEEAAEDSSFCSSASFVERLLIRQEKFTRRQKPLLEEDEHEESEISSRSVLSSSPLPPPVALQEEWHSCRSRVMKDLDDYLRTFDWVRGEVPNLEKDVRTAIGFETEDDQTSTFDSPENSRPVHPHVRFNEMVQKLTFPADSRVEESSINCESETEVESESDFGGRSDEVVVEDSEEVVEVRRPEVKPKTRVTPRKTQAAGRFRPAVLRSRLTRRKPKASAPKAKLAAKKPPVQFEESPKSEDLDLIVRAEQLNREMGIFRRENERVLALRRQLEAEKRKVQQTREKLTQDTVEQSKAMQKRLREEEDKLKRDRLAFEKFRREQKYAGDVKLQEEIRLLKLQLQDMEAELKEKDAKFGSAQSRYKMSLRKLENANDEMRAQVSKLEVENEKLKRQVAVLKNPKETTAAQKLTRQIHDVNDLISKTFFKNPGTSKKPANEQPLRGLLKRSPSESVHVEQTITAKPARSKSFGAEHEFQLREQSKKVEERLLKEAEEESCDAGAKDGGKTKVSKFPRIVPKEAEKVVDFREEPTRLASFDVSSEELRDFRPPTRSTEEKEKQNPPKSSSNISQISEASETSVCSKSTEASNRFFESEVVRGDGTIERTLADGRKECVFPNGNRKVVSPNGKCVKVVYYNGDVQEKFEDGTVEYFFAESRTWHTTKPDGTEIIELPSGEVQTRKSDGDVEVVGSDGLKVVQKPNGTKIAWQPNGTRVETKITGERTIYFPNGEQEVQTSDFKKRVYVDGTEKIVYSDGRQETRYSNGRLRIRDSRGNLVVDCFA